MDALLLWPHPDPPGCAVPAGMGSHQLRVPMGKALPAPSQRSPWTLMLNGRRSSSWKVRGGLRGKGNPPLTLEGGLVVGGRSPEEWVGTENCPGGVGGWLPSRFSAQHAWNGSLGFGISGISGAGTGSSLSHSWGNVEFPHEGREVTARGSHWGFLGLV